MNFDADTFRRVMGTFATGVTIVATNRDDRLHGVTVNSLTALSLDPVLLLICVDKQATAHCELEEAGGFGVSILSDGQEAISALFAESAEPEEHSLRGVDFRLGASGVPLVEGALGWLECTVEEILGGGDHSIFTGRVVAGDLGESGNPLLFFRGGYRRLGG